MNHNSDDFMIPSELDPTLPWPPSDDDIDAMELDAYDRQKLQALIDHELFMDEMAGVPTAAERNPNLK